MGSNPGLGVDRKLPFGPCRSISGLASSPAISELGDGPTAGVGSGPHSPGAHCRRRDRRTAIDAGHHVRRVLLRPVRPHPLPAGGAGTRGARCWRRCSRCSPSCRYYPAASPRAWGPGRQWRRGWRSPRPAGDRRRVDRRAPVRRARVATRTAGHHRYPADLHDDHDAALRAPRRPVHPADDVPALGRRRSARREPGPAPRPRDWPRRTAGCRG